MRADRVLTILRREYGARVKSKAFWVVTLLLPVVIALLVFVPAIVAATAESVHRLAVLDETGELGAALAKRLTEHAERTVDEGTLEDSAASQDPTRFEVEIVDGDDASVEALDRRTLDGEIDAWIRIDATSLESSRVEYHAESVANLRTQGRIETELTWVISQHRLALAGYDADEVLKLTQRVALETLKVTEEGTKAEQRLAGFILAYVLFLLLYMSVAIYGNSVLTGVLEEKSSRIVEVVLSTTRPSELLAGKLLGIGLAGLTQLSIWMLAIAALTAPAVVGALALGYGDVIPPVSAVLAFHFLGHFVLGYFLFATMYAAIGSATNSVQDAQPFSAFVMPFLVAPMLFMFAVINDPDSTLATVLSLIPPFTPLLMLLRIAVKQPPLWQIALGYALTAGFVVLLLAACARIYRIGILLYGKRPSFRELGRWILRS